MKQFVRAKTRDLKDSKKTTFREVCQAFNYFILENQNLSLHQIKKIFFQGCRLVLDISLRFTRWVKLIGDFF